MLRSLFNYKKYIIRNAIGELKYRYAGSALGFFWNLINPILQILVYTFVFSNIMRAKMAGIETPGGFSLYLCSGLFAWISFNECLIRGANTYIESSTYIKKLPIPIEVFVAQRTCSSLLNCLTNYVLIFVYAFILMGKVSLNWLFVPPILCLFLLMGFGLALFLAAINTVFRDTVHIVNVFMLIWMWATPIVYAIEIIPENFRFIMKFNIAYPFIHALQQIIVFGGMPDYSDMIKMCFFADLIAVLDLI